MALHHELPGERMRAGLTGLSWGGFRQLGRCCGNWFSRPENEFKLRVR